MPEMVSKNENKMRSGQLSRKPSVHMRKMMMTETRTVSPRYHLKVLLFQNTPSLPPLA